MLTVAAVTGLSIVIRSKDPRFFLNNMVFVTEYDEQDAFQTPNPLNVSIAKETDAFGQLIRISFSESSQRITKPPIHVGGLQNLEYSSPAQSLQGLQGSGMERATYSSPVDSSSSTDISSLESILGDDCIGDAAFDVVFSANTDSANLIPTTSTFSTSYYPEHQLQMQSHSAASSLPSPSLSHPELIDFPDTMGDVSIAQSFSQAVSSNSDNLHDSSEAPSSAYQSSTLMSNDPLDLMQPLIENNNSPTPWTSTTGSTDDSQSNDSSSEQRPSFGDPKRTLPCRFEGCIKRFARKYHRQVHENSHKPKLRQPLTCRQPSCTAQFGRPHDRMRHEVAKHGIRPQHICEECGKFFATHAKLSAHKCDRLPTQRHRYTGLKSK